LIALVIEAVIRIFDIGIPLSELKKSLEFINKPIEQKFFNQLKLQFNWQLIEDFLVLRGSQGIVLIVFPLVLEILGYSQLQFLVYVIIFIIFSYQRKKLG
jgi:hypothetical protein